MALTGLIPFGIAFVAWTLSTVVPALAGVAAVVFVGSRLDRRYVAFFALGIFLWFFVDTIEGSSDLVVNEGFSGGLDQVLMVGLFVVGVLSLLYFESMRRGKMSQGMAIASGLGIPLLAALAVGIHGLGEGTAFGSTASTTPSADLLDAFGGVSAGAAYVLHKALEPMIVGALYVGVMGSKKPMMATLRDVSILAFLFALPSLIGAVTGYFVQYDATYFFGLGTGTSVYALLMLAGQALGNGADGEWRPLKAGIALSIGLLLIYLAALLHS